MEPAQFLRQFGAMKWSHEFRMYFNPPSVGRRLRAIRYMMGYGERGNQQKFAKKHHWDNSTYSEWENGGRMLTIQAAARLVDTIEGLTLDYIYFNRARDVPLDLRRRLAEALGDSEAL